MILADTYQFDFPETHNDRPGFVDNWVLALSEIPSEILFHAFKKLLATWKPDFGRKFPVPGDITDIIDGNKETIESAEAEESWQKLLDLIDPGFHPNLGWKKGARAIFDAKFRMKHAASAAGGVLAIWNMTSTERQWAKKRFIEDYVREQRIEELSLPAMVLPALRGADEPS